LKGKLLKDKLLKKGEEILRGKGCKFIYYNYMTAIGESTIVVDLMGVKEPKRIAVEVARQIQPRGIASRVELLKKVFDEIIYVVPEDARVPGIEGVEFVRVEEVYSPRWVVIRLPKPEGESIVIMQDRLGASSLEETVKKLIEIAEEHLAEKEEKPKAKTPTQAPPQEKPRGAILHVKLSPPLTIDQYYPIFYATIRERGRFIALPRKGRDEDTRAIDYAKKNNALLFLLQDEKFESLNATNIPVSDAQAIANALTLTPVEKKDDILIPLTAKTLTKGDLAGLVKALKVKELSSQIPNRKNMVTIHFQFAKKELFGKTEIASSEVKKVADNIAKLVTVTVHPVEWLIETG
jgi:hypothetical protein